MKIIVENMRNFQANVRGATNSELHHQVHRRCSSSLGNPFPMEHESQREDVIAEYRIWLWVMIKSGNEPVLNELRMLARAVHEHRVVTLYCYCAPKPCHANVVARAVDWIIKTELMEG
jgi:hypothetical protein